MRAALVLAGIEPREVDYVNAHGTGTAQNDVAESRAISSTLPAGVPVSSTKGMTGHLLGACGATEAIFTALAVQHGELPPNAGAPPVDASLGLDVVLEPTPRRVRVAMSNAFAFGGSNAAVVITAP
jgi:3-oxoacyl-(acyl-carrier-protein) synthase